MWAHVCVREGDRDKKTKRQKEEDRDRERGGHREGFRGTYGLKLGTLLMPPSFSPSGGQVDLLNVYSSCFGLKTLDKHLS